MPLSVWRSSISHMRAQPTTAGASVIERALGDVGRVENLGDRRCLVALYGAEDRVLLDVAETFARVKRDEPHAEIVPLPGVGHFLQEEARELVAERLGRFFAA
jgi:pimeloyl-ACP methyl ester carboxylesterase